MITSLTVSIPARSMPGLVPTWESRATWRGVVSGFDHRLTAAGPTRAGPGTRVTQIIGNHPDLIRYHDAPARTSVRLPPRPRPPPARRAEPNEGHPPRSPRAGRGASGVRGGSAAWPAEDLASSRARVPCDPGRGPLALPCGWEVKYEFWDDRLEQLPGKPDLERIRTALESVPPDDTLFEGTERARKVIGYVFRWLDEVDPELV